MRPKYLWIGICVVLVLLTVCIAPSVRRIAASHGATVAEDTQAQTEPSWQDVQVAMSKLLGTNNQQSLEAAIGATPSKDLADLLVVLGQELPNETHDERLAEIKLVLVGYLDVFRVVDVVGQFL